MADKFDEMARSTAGYVDGWCPPNVRDVLAARIAALVRRAVEGARASVVHAPPLVKDGVAVCSRCGVVVPATPTCCRGSKPAIRARGEKEGR